MIESSMLDVTRKANLDIDQDLVSKIAEQMRQSNCSLKTHIKKLSKKHPISKLKVNIYRHLSREDGESWSVELNSKEKLLFQGYMNERPGCLDRSDYFKKSFWEDNFFIIHCRLNQEVFRININDFLD